MKRIVPFAEFQRIPDLGETVRWQGRTWQVITVDVKRELIQLED